MDHALEFVGVRKAFERFTLDGVSFSVPAGHLMGLIGPNGAGKTTIIRLALGLARCDGGVVRLLGQPAASAGSELRARVGFVHDSPTFYGHLTVSQMGRLVAPFYPTWDAARFDRLITEFGVPRRTRVRALSRGTRMKLALALALAHRAELLVFDEPTSGLDPVFRRDLLERLSAEMSDGRTSALVSSQMMSDLDRTADFVTFIRDGRLVHTGPKDDILDRWAVVRGHADLEPALRAAGPRGLQTSRQGVEALFEDLERARRLFGDRAVVDRATLDDVFLLCRQPPEKEA